MPRAIWSGTIAFGLVSVPVRMTSAVAEHTLHFHYVHEPDGSRIGYEKICKAEGKPVLDDEIVKAFEIEKGEWVYMSDEDFEAASVEQGAKTVDIRAFVPYEEIDPIYFERTYYLEPQEGGEKVYALLARALKESGLVGVAKLIMRDRQAPVDLMEALRASVEAAKGRRPAKRRSEGDGLAGLSKDELYELAKDADLPGRSEMSKDELVEALKAA